MSKHFCHLERPYLLLLYGKVSGTSDPHGYLFLSRVSRDTRDEDMLEWIENLNVNIIDFTRASHNEARSKSFVLTVNIRVS